MINDAPSQILQRIHKANGIADILDFRSRSHASKEALVCGEQRLTFNQLWDRARAIAAQLHNHKIRRGDRVALYMPNGIEFVASFFAITGLGAVVVPINPLLKPDEIKHIVQDSQSVALIVHEALLETAAHSLNAPHYVRLIIAAGTANTAFRQRSSSGIVVEELTDSLKVDNLQWPVSIEAEKELAVLVYTSGTTGKPKGAMLTHHNLLCVFPSRLDMFDIDDRDRCLAALPLCHIYGMTVIMIGTIARGGTLVVVPRFEAKSCLELIRREKITILPVVPAMYAMMLADIAQSGSGEDIANNSLRVCFSGGAPLPAPLLHKIEATFNAPVLEGYALTETACVATINPLHGPRKVNSVGIAVPGVRMAIFNEAGAELPRGVEHVGEIAVSGNNVMAGYWNQPAATSEVLHNGWFLTGDLGYSDEDGYIFIVGRKKELILRGGQNVYPREVEDVIMQLAGVREVAVIGVPDEIMGERVKAIVVTTSADIDEARIKEHCAAHLAEFKVPRLVAFTDALPRNSTGKVLKRLLS